MKSRIKEQGSAVHIVIIVALVVVILGALGFIFWQNFVNKPAANQQTSTASDTKPAEVTMKTGTQTLNGHTLTYQYPSDWIVTEKGVESSGGQVRVALNLVVPEGLGGTCGGDDEILDPLARTEWEALPDFSKAIFSSYAAKSAYGSGYYYSFELEPASYEPIKTAKVGDSACKAYSAVRGYIVLSETDATTLTGRADFIALTNDEDRTRQDLSLAEINEAFNSEDAKTAKQILLSVKVES